MDQRGQISVEYILIASIVLLVVVVFGMAITEQTEIDSVATAVRIGAENSTTYLSLSNSGMQPVRVTSVNITGTNNVNMQVKFSGPVTSIQSQILGSINKSLSADGFITGYTGGSQITFTTTKHNYTITIA
jgi:uncharacterized protein (UPF0333 family)